MSNNFEFCPICNSDKMGEEIITKNFEYKGHTLVIPNYKIYKCQNCEETFPDSIRLKQIEKDIRDFHRKTDALLSSDEIKHIRTGLGFTQEKFGEILGGGAKAFARYENGTITQSRPMDNLLRVIWHYPGGIGIVHNKPPIKLEKYDMPATKYIFESDEPEMSYKLVDAI